MENWKKKTEIFSFDEKIIKILVRTIKDFGLITKFKSFDAIENMCYHVRDTYVPNGTEGVFMNISFWSYDLFFRNDVIKDNDFSFDPKNASIFGSVFVARIINDVINGGLVDTTAVDDGFYERFFDCVRTYTEQYNEPFAVENNYFVKYTYEIDKAISYIKSHDVRIAKRFGYVISEYDLMKERKQHEKKSI